MKNTLNPKGNIWEVVSSCVREKGLYDFDRQRIWMRGNDMFV